MKPTVLLLPYLLVVVGCSNENSTKTASEATPSASTAPDTTAASDPSVPKPEALHVAEFVHQFPEGKENGNGARGGVTNVSVEGQPFYGFDDENYSSDMDYKGKGKTVNFRMKLLDRRDGKDICEITRSVDIRKTDGVVTSESKGAPMTVTVEYAGKELTIFDDEHGVSKFVPRAAGIGQQQVTESETREADD